MALLTASARAAAVHLLLSLRQNAAFF